MTSPPVRAAAALIRAWTTLYTCGLPPEVRHRRREEIASDISDHISDCGDSPVSLTVQLIARGVFGIMDDFGWRLEQRRAGWSWLTAAAAALLPVAAIVSWVVFAPAPAPPPPPMVESHFRTPAPPPPPPPPLPRAGTSASEPPIEFTYADTSYTVTPETAAPVRIKEVRPIYPPILKAAAVEGVVVVKGRISDDGRVSDLRLAQPAGILGQSAVAAISQWQFAPSNPTYLPSGRVLTVSVKFSLGK
jgi:TonB family protein